VQAALHGAGGLSEVARPTEPVKRGRPSKAKRQRAVTPRVVAAPRPHAPVTATKAETVLTANRVATSSVTHQEGPPIHEQHVAMPVVRPPAAPAAILSPAVAPVPELVTGASDQEPVQLPTGIDPDALEALDGMDTMFS
jgi:hypothetical protein